MFRSVRYRKLGPLIVSGGGYDSRCFEVDALEGGHPCASYGDSSISYYFAEVSRLFDDLELLAELQFMLVDGC